MKNCLLFLFVLCTILTQNSFAQDGEIRNVDFTVYRDSILITYDLTGNTDSRYTIWLEIDTKGQQELIPHSLAGDFGKGIAPGLQKQIVWYTTKDEIRFQGEIAVEVVAQSEIETSFETNVVEVNEEEVTTGWRKKWFIYAAVGANSGGGLKNFSEFDIWRDSITSYQNDPRISLGQSAELDFAIGYRINKNLHLECEVNFVYGKKYEITTNERSGSYFGSFDNTISGRSLRIIPSIIGTMQYQNLYPYLKFGLVLSSNVVEYDFTFQQTSNNYPLRRGSQSYELKGKAAPGAQLEAGSLYYFTPSVALIGAIRLVAMNFTPEKGKLTSYERNFDGAPFENIEFVDKNLDLSSADDTMKLHKKEHPFSCIGLKLGILFAF